MPLLVSKMTSKILTSEEASASVADLSAGAATLNAPQFLRHMQSLGFHFGETLGLAVSGGADSMALLYLLAPYFKLLVLTVDHGLRQESADEAAFVGRHCAKLERLYGGIVHHILLWQGLKPKKNIQAEAREKRYALMGQACQDAGIAWLLTAHHLDDQAETFLQRLARGSGLKGLASMRDQAACPNYPAVHILRPLLQLPKEALRAFLTSQQINWCEDPSNEQAKFERVKIRRFLQKPPLEGFHAARLAATASRLARAQSALDFYTDQSWQAYVRPDIGGNYSISPAFLRDIPDEIALRLLARAAQLLTGNSYPPEGKGLDRVLACLRAGLLGERAPAVTAIQAHSKAIIKEPRLKALCLGGCFITYQKERVFICRQAGRMPFWLVQPRFLQDQLAQDQLAQDQLAGGQEAAAAAAGLIYQERLVLPAFYQREQFASKKLALAACAAFGEGKGSKHARKVAAKKERVGEAFLIGPLGADGWRIYKEFMAGQGEDKKMPPGANYLPFARYDHKALPREGFARASMLPFEARKAFPALYGLDGSLVSVPDLAYGVDIFERYALKLKEAISEVGF